jgi:hypothetical protein
MAVHIRHKVNTRIDGLKRANRYLEEELGKAGVRIGRHVQGKVRQKQRIDTGQERNRTLWQSRSRGANLRVSIYNTVVQGLVDETGATWTGTMPPSHKGSKLYNWVLRKGIASRLGGGQRRALAAFVRAESRRAGASRSDSIQAGRQAAAEATSDRDKEVLRTTFLIARAIARRGLPRPGDPLRKPFEDTRREERPAIIAMVNNAVFRSVKRVNQT